MAYIKKKDAEKIFVDEVLEIGVKKLWETDGEGARRNTTYYQLELNNGKYRWWTNFSEVNLIKIKNSLSKTKNNIKAILNK